MSERALLPDSTDGKLQKIRTDLSVLIYDEKTMPRVYQDWRRLGPTAGVLLVTKNVSANPLEPFGNANREYPWKVTAGLDGVTEVTTFKFMKTPSPVVIWRERQRYTKSLPVEDAEDAYRWRFPTGTLIGEALVMSGPNGPFVFEVRTRKKVGADAWKPEVYRPALAAPPPPAGESSLLSVSDRLHPFRAIEERVADSRAVRLTKEQYEAALSAPFVPVRGEEGGINWEWLGEYKLAPKGHSIGVHPVATRSCMACHEHAFRHTDDFDVPRDWYGRVSGDDGIISFHPFGLIKGFGDPGLNQTLLKLGIISLSSAGAK